MAAEYSIEPSEGLLMIHRRVVEIAMGMAFGAGLKEQYIGLRKQHDQLGKFIRRKLRAMGYQKDCEISPEMDELVVVAHAAVAELMMYIVWNAPATAKLLAKHGDNYLQDWQDSHPTPIRP